VTGPPFYGTAGLAALSLKCNAGEMVEFEVGEDGGFSGETQHLRRANSQMKCNDAD
jgi:hypothetical protein